MKSSARSTRSTPRTSIPDGVHRGMLATGTRALEKPCLAPSRNRSSPPGTGRISPASPTSPNTRRPRSTGARGEGGADRGQYRKIRTRLGDADSADDVRVHIEALRGNPRVAVKDRQQHVQTSLIDSHGQSSRRAGCIVHQRLNLDQ